jgi:hypothetical protein
MTLHHASTALAIGALLFAGSARADEPSTHEPNPHDPGAPSADVPDAPSADVPSADVPDAPADVTSNDEPITDEPITDEPGTGEGNVTPDAIQRVIEREERAREADAFSEKDVDERLAFLEERIAVQRRHAEIWWTGWTAFYSIGAVVQGSRGMMADTDAEKAEFFVSCVQATGGAMRLLLDPYKGIQPFEPVDGPLTYRQRLARLRRGERILVENAENTQPFGPWYAHLLNVAINGTGAVIVGAGFDAWDKGLMAAGIGIAVGEVNILTAPWEADDDLEQYRQEFGGEGSHPRKRKREQATKWSIEPMGAGATLNATF